MSDDDGFAGYVETTADPGPWLNIATAAFCVLSIITFPFLVAFGRKYELRRIKASRGDIHREEETGHGGENDIEQPRKSEENSAPPSSYVYGKSVASGYINAAQPTTSLSTPSDANRRIAPSWLQNAFDKVLIPPYPDDETSFDNRLESRADIVRVLDAGGAIRRRNAVRPKRGQTEQKWEQDQLMARRLSMRNAAIETMFTSLVNTSHEQTQDYPSDESPDVTDNLECIQLKDVPTGTPLTEETLRRSCASIPKECGEEAPSTSSFFMHSVKEQEVLPDDALDSEGPPGLCETAPMEGEQIDLCCGERAWWSPKMIAAGFDRLLEIAENDKEMKRIVSLSIPFSLAAASEGAFETVRVALVANFIGTDAVGAYVIVGIILDLTQEFVRGFALTCSSLCAHAVGADNHFQAGQLVQISCILYSLCMIPNVLVWMFLTDDVVRLFGFDYATSLMAQDYARFYVFKQWFEGLEEAYGSLLCVLDHEVFYTVMRIGSEAVATLVILGIVLTRQTTLSQVGLIELLSEVLFFSLTLIITYSLGWIKDYTKGIYRSLGLGNTTAVKTVFKTAIPLAFGELLTYGEWEVLTIFVAYLGPAEVTAWGIAGSLWETIEKLTEGFGDAGELRTALHLGAARPASARLSSYKTILVSIIFATVITSILWILGEDVATWLTPDPTLQYLTVEVLPLIGIGNIALTAGSVCWALVGAQGRYRLATLTAFVSSWCITLPIAAIYTFVFRFDLQGVVSAVVIGYTVTGTCLQYILVRSDWERLSRLIIEENGGIESDSDSDSSSSDAESDSSSSDGESSSQS